MTSRSLTGYKPRSERDRQGAYNLIAQKTVAHAFSTSIENAVAALRLTDRRVQQLLAQSGPGTGFWVEYDEVERAFLHLKSEFRHAFEERLAPSISGVLSLVPIAFSSDETLRVADVIAQNVIFDSDDAKQQIAEIIDARSTALHEQNPRFMSGQPLAS